MLLSCLKETISLDSIINHLQDKNLCGKQTSSPSMVCRIKWHDGLFSATCSRYEKTVRFVWNRLSPIVPLIRVVVILVQCYRPQPVALLQTRTPKPKTRKLEQRSGDMRRGVRWIVAVGLRLGGCDTRHVKDCSEPRLRLQFKLTMATIAPRPTPHPTSRSYPHLLVEKTNYQRGPDVEFESSPDMYQPCSARSPVSDAPMW